MSIDWDLTSRVAVPFGTLVLGKYLEKWMNRGPKLISFLGHISTFQMGDPPIAVYTHHIFVRNAGKASANNVRLGHQVLTDYKIFPPTDHSIYKVKGGGDEIVIPRLLPGEQIIIAYIYTPPTTAGDVNVYVKSDEGYSEHVNALLTPQLPRWRIRIYQFYFGLGCMTFAYLLIELLRWVAHKV